MTGDIQEEEKRGIREKLSEEELAVFDLLTKPDIKLSSDEKQLVKRIVRDLIETLKKEKLVLDWRKKLATRAEVKVTIETILDQLPDVYTKEIWEEKCNATYRHFYECYYGPGMSVYGAMAT